MTTSEPAVDRRFPFGLTILFALMLAVLIGLGVWQVKRLAWKEDLLARIAALQTAPARPLAQVLAEAAAGKDVDFTRVTVVCPGLASAPSVDLYAVRSGQMGSRKISPCPISAGGFSSILVDRGFMAADPPPPPAPAVSGDQTPVTVVGVLRKADPRNFAAPADSADKGLFYTRDAAAMAPRLHAANPSPLFLFAETPTGWPSLVPAPIPPEISNRHLEYALTWFGLAATLACVYAAMLWRRLKA